MNPQDLIAALRESGLTMTEIGDAVGVSQASISRIADGSQQPRWALYNRLVELHEGRTERAA